MSKCPNDADDANICWSNHMFVRKMTTYVISLAAMLNMQVSKMHGRTDEIGATSKAPL